MQNSSKQGKELLEDSVLMIQPWTQYIKEQIPGYSGTCLTDFEEGDTGRFRLLLMNGLKGEKKELEKFECPDTCHNGIPALSWDEIWVSTRCCPFVFFLLPVLYEVNTGWERVIPNSSGSNWSGRKADRDCGAGFICLVVQTQHVWWWSSVAGGWQKYSCLP